MCSHHLGAGRSFVVQMDFCEHAGIELIFLFLFLFNEFVVLSTLTSHYTMVLTMLLSIHIYRLSTHITPNISIWFQTNLKNHAENMSHNSQIYIPWILLCQNCFEVSQITKQNKRLRDIFEVIFEHSYWKVPQREQKIFPHI